MDLEGRTGIYLCGSSQNPIFIIRTTQNYSISCKSMAQYCSGTFVWATQNSSAHRSNSAHRTCASGAQATLCRKFIIYYKNCQKLLNFVLKHVPVLLRHICLGHPEGSSAHRSSSAHRTCASGAQATFCRKFIIYYKNCQKLLNFWLKHGPVLLRHIRLGHLHKVCSL